MRKLPALKTLTTILLICTGAFVAVSVPFLLMALAMPDMIPFTINGNWATEMKAEDYILLIANMVAIAFYAYALYLFKNVLTLFEKKKLFDLKVIRNLDQAGKAVLIGFVIMAGSDFMYEVLINGNFKINLDFYSIFTIMTGFFLIVLSEVFLVAKSMKEENDLTI